MTGFKATTGRLKDWLIAGVLGLIAAIFYFASLADYAFPGESAHLTAVWRGLDADAVAQYPLMGAFAKMLGGGNLIAPLCGILAVVLLYMLVKFFCYERINGEHLAGRAGLISRVAGVSTAVIFMLTPAVRSAATHLEPRLFDAAWALLTLALFIPYARAPKAVSLLFPLALGVFTALGFCDSALFLTLTPLIVAGIVVTVRKRTQKPYLPLFLFLLSAFIAFLVGENMLDAKVVDTLKSISEELDVYHSARGWIFIGSFATLPCLAVLFSSYNAYNEKPGLVQWIYHVTLTFVSILAIATPLSPSSVMEVYGYLPVATSAFAAIVAGHLISYWWIHRRTVIGLVSGGLYLFVLLFTLVWNIFTFDGQSGAFADATARKVIADLGDRTWLVTDGMLDDHLRLAAAAAGKEINLVAMSRDLDDDYLERLSDLVRAKKVGGDRCDDLALSLKLGVLPFVQDWLAIDTEAVRHVAVFGVPDLWYSAGAKAVPEFLFFGADPKRTPDWSAWKEFDALLAAPKGWGSYRNRKTDNPVERLRYQLRRHIGFVANDRGVYLQDNGKDDEAYAMYELVLNEIDCDNVCALFNEVEMAGAKYPKALAHQRDLEHKVKRIIDDKDRRYQLWWLGRYYGYIRNPDIFVRMGFTWARSGRPGDALAHLRRAIDFVPNDKRAALLNMMAALYAVETDQTKSRRIYETLLKQDANNHDALIGMMRLEMQDGNSKAALAYLERAASASPANTRTSKIDAAMVALMKEDLRGAKEILRKLTDADAKDVQAWSLLAAVTMQQCDAEKDEKARAALEKELITVILPKMESQVRSPVDYYLQTTKAFILLRQGEAKRREARDAFVAATKARPDMVATQDLVLGLDISLDDKENAEKHARDVLRRNRKAPLANYVMGSLALGRGNYKDAETYLRRSVDTKNPTPLALNDLAELLRRTSRYDEGAKVARQCIKVAPKLYVGWETLASILLTSGQKLDEAEACAKKACELSRDEKGRETDVRMLITLARVQAKRGDLARAKGTVRKVRERIAELSNFEKKEFDDFVKALH